MKSLSSVPGRACRGSTNGTMSIRQVLEAGVSTHEAISDELTLLIDLDCLIAGRCRRRSKFYFIFQDAWNCLAEELR